MLLKRVEIEGFKSFKDKSTLELTKNAGLTLIRGKNTLNNDLQSNGSGKSSLTDAICWCLYGKTSRGVSASHIESWRKSKNIKVEVTLEIDNIDYVITRTRKPIAILKNGDEVTQNVIDDLLGISYDRFLSVVLMGQKNEFFPEVKPAARLELLSQVLGLGMWNELADNAKTQVKEAKEDIEDIESEISVCETSLANYNEMVKQVIDECDTWQSNQDDRIKSAQESASRAEKVYEAAKEEYGKIQAQREQIESQISALESELEGAKEERAEKLKEKKPLEKEVTECETELKAIDRRARKILELGDVCPTCDQKVDPDHVKNHKDQFEKEKEGWNGKLSKLEESLDSVEKELEEIDLDITDIKTEISENKLEIKKLASGMDIGQLSILSFGYESSKKDVIKLKDESNPHLGRSKDLKEKVKASKDTYKKLKKELKEAEHEHNNIKNWPKLFKELRLYIVNQALAELEIYTNSCLVELGLKDWSIEFQVEKESENQKSVQRKLYIIVHSPENDKKDGVPWESWSGGETQRLNVACAVGLASLIRSRMPSAPLFEFWDEPTGGMTVAGAEDLIRFFGERAKDRQIWIVDHMTLDSGAFDDTFTVVKDEKRFEDRLMADPDLVIRDVTLLPPQWQTVTTTVQSVLTAPVQSQSTGTPSTEAAEAYVRYIDQIIDLVNEPTQFIVSDSGITIAHTTTNGVTQRFVVNSDGEGYMGRYDNTNAVIGWSHYFGRIFDHPFFRDDDDFVDTEIAFDLEVENEILNLQNVEGFTSD